MKSKLIYIYIFKCSPDFFSNLRQTPKKFWQKICSTFPMYQLGMRLRLPAWTLQPTCSPSTNMYRYSVNYVYCVYNLPASQAPACTGTVWIMCTMCTTCWPSTSIYRYSVNYVYYVYNLPARQAPACTGTVWNMCTMCTTYLLAKHQHVQV